MFNPPVEEPLDAVGDVLSTAAVDSTGDGVVIGMLVDVFVFTGGRTDVRDAVLALEVLKVGGAARRSRPSFPRLLAFVDESLAVPDGDVVSITREVWPRFELVFVLRVDATVSIPVDVGCLFTF